MHNLITRIEKREKEIVLFNKDKITEAIKKAAIAAGGHDTEKAEELANRVVTILEYKYDETEIPKVEEIQNIIERVLIKAGCAKTAKTFILYREKRRQAREAKTTMVHVQDTIDSYLGKADWRVKENSNEDYSFSGLLLYTAGKVIANHALNNIYPSTIGNAHRQGYIHVHDLSHGFIGYCCGHSLKNLLLWGFGGVPNKTNAGPAKHIDVVVHQMVNYIGCLQMEFAGAQAFSSVDTLIAPFVKADGLNYKQVKQAIQKLIYSLNVPSRWGSQYPFSNLTFDWVVPEDMKNEKAIVGGKEQDFTYGDCQAEIDMINKAFIEVMLGGDYNGRVFTFPIPTYNITKDFNWNSENAELLFELTAKYGLPYFQNYLGSNLDPKSIRAMCCRLNLDQNELLNRPGGMWSMGDSTGSIGVVTLNMAILGYEAKNKEEFFEKIKYYMTLSKDSLEIKRKIITKNLENGLMPYTKRYLGHFNNHFSTIGLCGMHEACLNLINEGINTDKGKQLAIDALNFMRKTLKEFQKETGNLYNLEASPAEGASYRLAKTAKKLYPDIKLSGENEVYLTNSTFLSADFTDDVVLALEHQNDIQPLYTGGTIFHTFVGEQITSPEACKQLVKKISSNTRLPYFSITPTFSICEDHGYIKGEVSKCPKCNKETEIYSRIVGYIRPIKNWHKGKREEFRQRKDYLEEKAITNEFHQKLTRENPQKVLEITEQKEQIIVPNNNESEITIQQQAQKEQTQPEIIAPITPISNEKKI